MYRSIFKSKSFPERQVAVTGGKDVEEDRRRKVDGSITLNHSMVDVDAIARSLEPSTRGLLTRYLSNALMRPDRRSIRAGNARFSALVALGTKGGSSSWPSNRGSSSTIFRSTGKRVICFPSHSSHLAAVDPPCLAEGLYNEHLERWGKAVPRKQLFDYGGVDAVLPGQNGSVACTLNPRRLCPAPRPENKMNNT